MEAVPAAENPTASAETAAAVVTEDGQQARAAPAPAAAAAPAAPAPAPAPDAENPTASVVGAAAAAAAAAAGAAAAAVTEDGQARAPAPAPAPPAVAVAVAAAAADAENPTASVGAAAAAGAAGAPVRRRARRRAQKKVRRRAQKEVKSEDKEGETSSEASTFRRSGVESLIGEQCVPVLIATTFRETHQSFFCVLFATNSGSSCNMYYGAAGEEKDVSAWDKKVHFVLQHVFMILLRGRPPLCVVTLHFVSAWLIASKAEPTLYVTYFIKCVCHEYVIRVGFKSIIICVCFWGRTCGIYISALQTKQCTYLPNTFMTCDVQQ